MRNYSQNGGNAAALGWSLVALAGLTSAAAKKTTTDIITSTLLIPSVSTASGDHIQASVVSVEDGDDGLTTLTLQCTNEASSSACANTVFADQTFIYGPATVSVDLDHAWTCAVSTPTASASSSSAVCAYSDASPVTAAASTTTVTGDAFNTAVTITSGVEKLRAKKTKTTTTSPSTPTTTAADDGSALCKRIVKGGGSGSDGGGDTADDGSSSSTTPKTGDTDDDGTGSTTTTNPCSGASRLGLDTSVMGTIAAISGLGFMILCL
ncbi:hypothetical protein MGN70_007287 [Eutypa lata]|nr:hypothetical protein MGN70_007287 [Eutypa lata]